MRTTITINDKLLRVLKQQALDSDATVSSLIEQAITQQILEDLEDLESVRATQHEKIFSFDSLVAEFKAEGLI